MLKLSICIVALNEENYLPNLLQNIKDQMYPLELVEVVLVDSGSIDKTKTIMETFASENSRFFNVQIIDNPRRNQAAGWNLAITHAKGDLIFRIDAHAILPPEFISRTVEDIEGGEDIVGGIIYRITANETAWGRTLLALENSMFGSGIGRNNKKRTYVKSNSFAAYRKQVFENVGLFNEKLLRTEDNEMHYRIRKAGYKILHDPLVCSYVYARGSLKQMVRQKWGNGYWVGMTLGICPHCLSLYHLLPLAFVVAILTTTVLSILNFWVFSAIMWSFYALLAIIATILSIKLFSRNFYAVLLPFLFLILHLSYGLGTLTGILEILKRKITRRPL